MDGYTNNTSVDQAGHEYDGGTNMFERFLFKTMRECLELKQQEALSQSSDEANDVWCSRAWDGSLCWPPMKLGEIKRERCPDFLTLHDTNEFVVRTCSASVGLNDSSKRSAGPLRSNEEALIIDITGGGLSNYSRCTASKIRHSEIVRLYQEHIPLVKVISRVGYSSSLLLLLTAFFVLSSCRRLRCARNQLHCQLFLSYMLRASVILAKDFLFIDGVGFRKDLESNQKCPWCKAFICLFHYSMLANHAWMFVEGLYLYGLVYRALHSTQYKASFGAQAIIAAWLGPLWIVVPWAILRLKLDNRLCWTTHESVWLLWLLQAPICITVVLNFCLFVRISRVLLNRVLRPEIQPASANQQHTYKEWFKASLILIPLLASHYVVLLAMNLLSNLMPPIVEIVWFYIDALFTSFQGAFVSFLYCFASPEVHSHLRRKLHASRGEGSFQSSNTKCKRFRLRRIQHYSDCHNNAAGKGQGPRLTSASPVICAGNKSTYETHQQNIDRLSCSEQRYKGILIKNTSSADCVINQVNRIACSNCTTTSKTGNEQTDV